MVKPKEVTKKTKGRQRIEMKRLVGSRQQVTLSKRRAGLFKKAAELCVLCGAEVAILTLNDKGKMFGFGHPNVETVINRYVSGCTLAEPFQKFVSVHEFNTQYAQAQKELEVEKKRLAEIEEAKKKQEANGKELRFWWDEPLEENMGLEELQQYMWALKEVRRKVGVRVDELMIRSSSPLMSVMEMGFRVGNHVPLGDDFVDWEWANGEGSGFCGSHGFGFGQDHNI
ncbi:Agamous-like MADS-box protein AGL62 [Morella rubra]|uniref:Agamous-like MADS-box protein AGL62 n=1 Tax=Morella rubra TaxID=262757 RepID=A0A6A1UK16_9ROSI|nr:Agamous-like MADS-box protein AGL62 [Morella rubra]